MGGHRRFGERHRAERLGVVDQPRRTQALGDRRRLGADGGLFGVVQQGRELREIATEDEVRHPCAPSLDLRTRDRLQVATRQVTNECIDQTEVRAVAVWPGHVGLQRRRRTDGLVVAQLDDARTEVETPTRPLQR